MTDPAPPPAPPSLDVVAHTPTEAVERSWAAITADGRSGIWISLVAEADALAAAARVEARLASGERLALAGTTLAVKDNIDVAGLPTTAGCPAYAYSPTESAPAVQALVDAGAVVIGKTNLDQFATGLVGTRSPYGACPNAHWPGLVSGGSSSGSAVAVATGMVDLALGTDTAGSGRVPAAANGIVGVKPTKGRISTEGVVPACATLDCVSVFARTVAEARRAADLAAGPTAVPPAPVRRTAPGARDQGEAGRARFGGGGGVRIGVPRPIDLDFDHDPGGPARHAAAVAALLATLPGAEVVAVDLTPFAVAAALLYGGSFVAERYAAVGEFVAAHPDDVDPVVGPIILAAADHPAWAVFRDQAELRRLAVETAPVWDAVDVLVVPSVPRIPTQAEVAADPIGVNSMLGTYTNFVNLLDLAAITIPVGEADGGPIAGVPATRTEPASVGPPPSLTLIGPAGSDEALAALAGRLA